MTDELEVDRDIFVAVVLFDLAMLTELGERRGFLGGGRGTGGSAGLVFSYRKPTTLVSSRKEARPVEGRFLCRTEANLVGNMLKIQLWAGMNAHVLVSSCHCRVFVQNCLLLCRLIRRACLTDGFLNRILCGSNKVKYCLHGAATTIWPGWGPGGRLPNKKGRVVFSSGNVKVESSSRASASSATKTVMKRKKGITRRIWKRSLEFLEGGTGWTRAGCAELIIREGATW